jgi:hypothetical protein
VPKSGFPAALWVSVWTHRRQHGVSASPKHEGFGRIRLGARLDIRGTGHRAGNAYRRQSAWEDPIRVDSNIQAPHDEQSPSMPCMQIRVGHDDVPLFQAPAGASGRTRVTAALCRTVDFQERLLQIEAFAQNPSSYAVGDGYEIHRDERAHLAFLDEPLRAITVIPSPLPKFHPGRSIRLGSDALMGMALM